MWHCLDQETLKSEHQRSNTWCHLAPYQWLNMHQGNHESATRIDLGVMNKYQASKYRIFKYRRTQWPWLKSETISHFPQQIVQS